MFSKRERQIVPPKECPTSPREADRAVSLPLPKATPSLEMFSRETERLSLIEKTGLLAGRKSTLISTVDLMLYLISY